MTVNEPAPAQPSGQPDSGDPGGPAPRWTLADKINYLFDTVRRPDGSRFSNDAVAATMARIPGGSQISGAYLSLLRRGERENPTMTHLQALAGFFSVSPAYFFDDAQFRAIADELQGLRALRDAGVQKIAMRLGGISADSLVSIAGIVEQVRRIEGLDKGAAGPTKATGPTKDSGAAGPSHEP